MNSAIPNVVGYTTYECTAGKWYLISAMFEKTGGGDVNLQDLVKGDARLVPGDNANDTSSPLIQYWNPTKNGVGGYEMFYFLNKAYDTGYKSHNNVWSKGKQGYDSSIALDVGRGFWFHPIADCTITVAGQVAEATKQKTVLAGKWNMIANPYPCDFVINGGKVDWLATGLVPGENANDSSSPLIQYWNPTKNGVGGYEMFYFLIKAYDTGYKSHNNVWSKGKQGYTADSFVPAGYGFWIYGTKAMFGDKDSIDINFSL